MGIVKIIDNNLALLHKYFTGTKDGLVSILFHTLYKDRDQVNRSSADPQQSITLEDFERIIVYYLERNYKFITQDELVEGMLEKDKYCFLTFDDGYFNNILAIKIMEKYNVPATFYCSTAPIMNNKCFWWDVYYRERKKLGVSIEKIRSEKIALKKLRIDEIEKMFKDEFGANVFNPIDNTDRPFTPDELKDFAAHPLVHIGNHTHNHLILPNYGIDEIIEDIKLNQKLLVEITGIEAPSTIAYPNGNINISYLPKLKEIGLKAGVTAIKGKNYLPFNPSSDDAFYIKRFTPWHHNYNEMLPLTETDFHIKKYLP